MIKIDKKNDNGNKIGEKIIYGFAKYMRDALPNATYLGFTGTAIEKNDANTPAVFGNYVDIYDIARAASDGATVKIFYESRLAKINLSDVISSSPHNIISNAKIYIPDFSFF